jgi:CDP-diglyceride synthetase
MTSSAPASKAKKILKRTLVGGSLVCVVAGLLWWTSEVGDGRPIFYAVALLTLAAAWETSRMGSLALYDLFPSLALATLVVLALVNAGLESAAAAHEAAPPAPAGTAFLQATPSLLYGYALLTGLAAYSFFRLALALVRQRTTARVATFLVIGALILIAIDDVQARTTHLSLVLWIFGGICVLGLLPREPGHFARLSLAGLLCAWIVPALPLLVFFHQRFGTRGLIALLVLSKFGDTCGYYVGNAIGKSHPFPRISPGKTTAGCVGSFVGVVAMGGVLWAGHVVPDGGLGLAGALLAAAIANLAAQSGDLLESYVKRKAGVKDSSGAFGPSGGLLDQLDSLLVSVPVACLAWPILLA